MTNYIAEAIEEAWGERCSEFDPECHCCRAWKQYDDLRTSREWKPISSAPQDRMIEVVGRYVDATAGFPRYAGYVDGKWWEFSRFEPQELVCWAWRERDDWPTEQQQAAEEAA